MADGTAQQCGRVGSCHILLKVLTFTGWDFFYAHTDLLSSPLILPISEITLIAYITYRTALQNVRLLGSYFITHLGKVGRFCFFDLFSTFRIEKFSFIVSHKSYYNVIPVHAYIISQSNYFTQYAKIIILSKC